MTSTIDTIRAAPLEIQASEERDGVSRVVVSAVAIGHTVHRVWSRWRKSTIAAAEHAIRSSSEWRASLRRRWVNEAAAFSVRARTGYPECTANLGLVFWMAWYGTDISRTVCELTLDTVSAALLLLPVSADFGLVEANLPVVGTWAAHHHTLSLVDEMRKRHLRLRVGVDLPLGSDGWLGLVIHVCTGGRRYSCGTRRIIKVCGWLREELRPHKWGSNLRRHADTRHARREGIHSWERTECVGGSSCSCDLSHWISVLLQRSRINLTIARGARYAATWVGGIERRGEWIGDVLGSRRDGNDGGKGKKRR